MNKCECGGEVIRQYVSFEPGDHSLVDMCKTCAEYEADICGEYATAETVEVTNVINK